MTTNDSNGGATSLIHISSRCTCSNISSLLQYTGRHCR